jgi:hypothetical protein
MKFPIFSTCLIALFVLSTGLSSHAETVVIDESLAGSASAGKQVGGSFTSEGYMPGKGTKHILYELPETVREGYLEYEVKGMLHSKVNEPEHGFSIMYDGRGMTEPCAYNPFKYNYYRWNVHWRQNRSAMKSVIHCANTDRYPLTNESAVWKTNEDWDWATEPTGKGVAWDENKWHIFRVTWQSKTFKVEVDGAQVWKVSGPWDYQPVKHRVWIGSGPGKYSSTITDIVFRNVKLVSFHEVQTLTGGTVNKYRAHSPNRIPAHAQIRETTHGYEISAPGRATESVAGIYTPEGRLVGRLYRNESESTYRFVDGKAAGLCAGMYILKCGINYFSLIKH